MGLEYDKRSVTFQLTFVIFHTPKFGVDVVSHFRVVHFQSPPLPTDDARQLARQMRQSLSRLTGSAFAGWKSRHGGVVRPPMGVVVLLMITVTFLGLALHAGVLTIIMLFRLQTFVVAALVVIWRSRVQRWNSRHTAVVRVGVRSWGRGFAAVDTALILKDF